MEYAAPPNQDHKRTTNKVVIQASESLSEILLLFRAIAGARVEPCSDWCAVRRICTTFA